SVSGSSTGSSTGASGRSGSRARAKLDARNADRLAGGRLTRLRRGTPHAPGFPSSPFVFFACPPTMPSSSSTSPPCPPPKSAPNRSPRRGTQAQPKTRNTIIPTRISSPVESPNMALRRRLGVVGLLFVGLLLFGLRFGLLLLVGFLLVVLHLRGDGARGL